MFFLNLDEKQLEDFSKIGKDLRELLPKTSKFVEFDFKAIDSEDMKIAQKEITHKYWDIRNLFNDGAVSLKNYSFSRISAFWIFQFISFSIVFLRFF